MRSGAWRFSPAKTRRGAIASSAGSATATPSPRRTARLEICLFILHLFTAAGTVPPELERVAPSDFHDERRHPVAVLGHRLADSLQRRRVVILYAPAQRIDQQFLRKTTDEVVLPGQDQGPQFGRPLEREAVGKARGRVDGMGAVDVAPGADRIIVLEREADRVHPLVAGGAARVGPVLLEALAQGELAV